MKQIVHLKYFLFLFTFTIIFSSCDESLNGSGEIITTEYEMSAFNFVELNMLGKVNIIPGTEQSVTLTTNENLHNNIRIESINNRLILEVEEGLTIKRYDMLEFNITMPNILGAELNGAGDIFIADTISNESFRIGLDGSGNVEVNNISGELVIANLDGSGNITVNKVDAKNLHITIDGSGNVGMDGIAEVQNISIDGSGRVRNFNTPSNTTNVNISGSGNCEVTASDFLNVEISGSGNAYYKGTATIDSKISGSGKVIHTP